MTWEEWDRFKAMRAEAKLPEEIATVLGDLLDDLSPRPQSALVQNGIDEPEDPTIARITDAKFWGYIDIHARRKGQKHEESRADLEARAKRIAHSLNALSACFEPERDAAGNKTGTR